MTSLDTTSFRPSVELSYAPDSTEPGKLKPGRDVHLVARFRDFLGGPTNDVGVLKIATTRGVVFLGTERGAGNEIVVDPPFAGINELGELPIILRPQDEFGKTEITVTCSLGEAGMVVDLPAPSTFALSEIMESVIYAFLVAIVIRIFFFQTFWIPSGSMEPTLYKGDRIIANKLIYRVREPQRGEVVIFRVFQPSGHAIHGLLTLDEAQSVADGDSPSGVERSVLLPVLRNPQIEVQDYIKRVIGLPGDVVEVRDGEILVNGMPIQEGFETRPPDYDHYGPLTVPPGEIFVLGDNRSNSQDSHVIGTVPIRNVEGRAEIVFWPLRRVMLIPQP